jgi:predicted Zn-dependent peptidase
MFLMDCQKNKKSQISKCLHDTTTKDATTYIIGLIESSMLIDASSLEKQNMKLLCNYLKRFRLFFLSAFLKQYPTTLPSVSVKDINTAAIRALYLVSGI